MVIKTVAIIAGLCLAGFVVLMLLLMGAYWGDDSDEMIEIYEEIGKEAKK